MKVTLVGNSNNASFLLGHALRSMSIESEVHTTLYANHHNVPHAEMPEYRGRDPPWVIYYKKRPLHLHALYLSKVIRKGMREGAVVSDMHQAVHMAFQKVPFLMSHGEDMRWMVWARKPRYIAMRRAARKSPCVFIQLPDTIASAERLGLRKWHYLPTPINTEFWRPGHESDDRDAFRVFAPTRHHWKIKGNDKLIRGFARFAKGNTKARLILTRTGPDWERAADLCRELGIANKVEWRGFLAPEEMRECVWDARAVADDFNIHSLSKIALEAMAAGIPAIASLDRGPQNAMGIDPPVLDARTPEEIESRLRDVEGGRIHDNTQGWVRKHHATEIGARAIMSELGHA